MSELSDPNKISPADCDPDARIWNVEIDGSLYGPYSVNQISSYLAENRVRPSSELFSTQWPEKKWTVSEMLALRSATPRQNVAKREPVSPPSAPPAAPVSRAPGTGGSPILPERSPEITKTLSRPMLTEARPEDDPATGLFDVLQTVRVNRPASRAAATPQIVGVSRPRGGVTGNLWRQPQRLFMIAAISVVVVGSMAMMIQWLKASGKKLENMSAQNESGVASYKSPVSSAPIQTSLPPAVSAPSGIISPSKPAFKPAPRLIMPTAVHHAPAPAATQSAAENRGDRNDNDRRDARDSRDNDLRDPRDPRDLRDANAARDPRDFRDARDTRNAQDPRDLRDSQQLDLLRGREGMREELAPGVDPNTAGSSMNGAMGNPHNGQPEDPNSPYRR